jgi:predicted protein tyrosine phosphatase
MNPIKAVSKGWRILTVRLRDQGLKTTLIWLYGRGMPKLTGVPLVSYSQITPLLYVGPQYGKRGKTKLERLGIHHSVNMRIEFDDAEHGLALTHYCYLPTIDDAAPSLDHLDQGARFIKQAVDAGQPVYIHCAGGVGRAPAIAAAYFVHEGKTLDEAVSLIQAKRPFIRIMPEQLVRLREFEQTH